MFNKIKLLFLLLLLLLPFWGCTTISNADKKSLVNKSSTPLIAAQNSNNKLFVFIGEKIELEPIPLKEGEISMDASFNAEYSVIQNVYGNYDKDTIKFTVYDHYGTPPFSKHKNVMLFVSEHKGKFYHEKYQYFDVYKTKDGRWASCGDPYRFDDYHRKEFKPAKLEFDEPLLFDLNEFKDKYIEAVFKEPYFKVDGNKAECLLGAFVEDLFTLKKDGVLKARGLF